jgi:hypothetical protein
MNPSAAVAQPSLDAQVKQWTWKTPAMRRMTLAICRLALARGPAGTFSALDLETHGEDAHGGSGIAGTVFRQLSDAGIIGPVGAVLDGEFIQRRVRNACGNPIGVWRLAHPGLARALIQAHGEVVESLVQTDLFGRAG